MRQRLRLHATFLSATTSGSTTPFSKPFTTSLERPAEVCSAKALWTRQLGTAALYGADKNVLIVALGDALFPLEQY
jgi:hypothetical protein